MKRLLCTIGLGLLAAAAPVYAQKASLNEPIDPRTTQAYSMLIERQVKVQAELEALLKEYSSSWPSTKKLQAELDALKNEMKKMSEMDQLLMPKLTLGVGSLILRKTTLISEIKMLAQEEGPEWPTLKEKQRELEPLDQEIQKILS
jgi:uncharacterized protein involved in exopolysaccharide biosynthesis